MSIKGRKCNEGEGENPREPVRTGRIWGRKRIRGIACTPFCVGVLGVCSRKGGGGDPCIRQERIEGKEAERKWT